MAIDARPNRGEEASRGVDVGLGSREVRGDAEVADPQVFDPGLAGLFPQHPIEPPTPEQGNQG
jgi:hypothetical protein